MATTVKHPFVSPKADGPDTTLVRPSSWNVAHDLASDAQSFVLGRDTSGDGPIQELPLGIDPDGTLHPGGQAIDPPSGTTALRPAAPTAGMIRYNTDLLQLEAFIGGFWMPIAVGGAVPIGGTIGWYGSSLVPGYLWANGQTIGNPASTADRKDLLYQSLFVFLWNNVPSLKAGVLPGGPGATALADWTANKKIALPDECGRLGAGTNNMGGIPTKSRLTTAIGGVDGDVLGAAGGLEGITQTLGMMPNHTHDGVPFAGASAASTGGSVLGVGFSTTTGNVTGYPGAQLKTPVVQPTIVRNVLIKF